MKDTKILIIEDNIVTLGDLEMRIGQMGYQHIETAVSGEEAIEIAETFKPDLILSDINLGDGITGIEAVRQIKAKQDVPVVYLTAYDDDSTLAEAGITKPYAYLLKPLQERELQISLSIALDKHRYENALKDSEELFRTVATQAKDAIIMIDTNDEVKLWNKAAQEMFGYSEDEIIGKKLHPLIAHPKYAQLYETGFKNFVHTGHGKALNKTKELTAIRKNKEEFPVELSLTSLNIKNKLHALAIVRDVSARKDAEELILQQNFELLEANATKDRFISILGHDLRNPFNSLIGLSELLLKNINIYDKPKIKELVEYINTSSRQTFNLLNNLLEWSRIKQGKITFNPGACNLLNLVYETYTLVNHLAEAKHIDILLEIPEKWEISIDAEMIKTVVRNLLNNAIKFTPEGGRITISGRKFAETVQIEISDTGVGMDEKTIDSLFRIEETMSRPGTNGEKGTGFGLLLCKEFVDKHNGTITVESEIGKGSKFIISLPIDQ